MGSEESEKSEKGGLIKTIAKVAFSHIGLCAIVVIYCVIGGFLFELLEKENEISACMDARKEYNDMENSTLFSLLDVILDNPLESNATDAQLVGIFESFRNNVIAIDYDGSWCEGYGTSDGPTHEWTFAGGLFFSMTVITTIGYGHIAPKTIWGRVLCISYAMMGIPLMLLFLANIGDVLADIFRYIYATIICCGCFKAKRKNKESPGNTSTGDTGQSGTNRKLSSIEQQQMMGNLKRRGSIKGHRVSPAMSREPSVSGSTEGIVTNAFAPDKTSLASSSHSGSSADSRRNSGLSSQKNKNPLNIKVLDQAALAERSCHFRKDSPSQPLVVDDDSDYDEDEERWEELSNVSVPLTVSLGIIGLYIFGGAILFKFWEGWDMTQSGYFCFITLSTIGFGDVTPGRDFSDPMVNARLVIGTVYSIFGMAILSMCFTLMQEEMVSKFMWLGRKMGVVEEDDPDALDDEQFTSLDKHGQRDKNSSDC